MPNAKEELDLEPILVEIGQFGKYQVRNYFCILVAIVCSALYVSQYIFMAAVVDYRCVVQECEPSGNQFAAWWWDIGLPPGSEARCSKFQPITNATCVAGDFLNATVPCDAWVYSSNNTIVAEFDLACQEWKRALVGTIHSVGMFVALPITGFVSDRWGRRTALCITGVLGGLMGLIRSFSTTYIGYLVLEFLDAALGSGLYSTGFILAVELVGSKWRVLGGNLVSMAFAVGQVTLALLAWAVPYWRDLTRLLYAPSLLFFLYHFFIEESVRWLLANGKSEEATRIIIKAASINGKTLSKDTLKKLSNDPKETDKQIFTNLEIIENETKPRSLFLEVIRSRIILGRLAMCSFWWITVTLVYYGLSINSVSLAGNSYVNYALTSLVEVPGYALSIVTLDRFGRKLSIGTSFLICGAALIVLPFIPTTVSWLATALSMVGKLCISMTFSSIYIFTSELFPTSGRHSLLGFCSMVGRIGSIVAPQTPLLMAYSVWLPYIIFGSVSLISSGLVMMAPETLGAALPDTVKHAEDIKSKGRIASKFQKTT